MDISQQSEIIHPASQLEDVALTATLPQDMVIAQKALIAWCEKKVAVCNAEVDELKGAVEQAKKHKWKSSVLETQHRNAVKRFQYYEKVKAALIAGFYIVPNFPIQMFAIKKGHHSKPRGRANDRWHHNFEQKSAEMPLGEGEYKNPFPLVSTKSGKDVQGKDWAVTYAKEWDDFEFPITMAKPEIMSITAAAMRLKIFDQIGVMPHLHKKKEDPVIIGQIFRKSGYTTRTVSFMIAWHLNTNVL